MLLRLLHKLWAHEWREMVHIVQAAECVARPRVTTFTRTCRCGGMQAFQVQGELVNDGAEVEMLRKMFSAS